MTFEDAMLEVSWKNLENQDNRYKDIDNKAIAIITVTGILVSFLAGSSSPLQSGHKGAWILFILTVISFLLTAFFSILVIRVRDAEMLSSNLLIEAFGDKEDEMEQIRGTIVTIAKVEDSYRKTCNIKAYELRRAVIALGGSVILLILYTISAFIRIDAALQ